MCGTYHVHFASDTLVPVVPEHGYAADADGDRPRGAHQQPRHQLRHVPAVVQRVHYCYVPAIQNIPMNITLQFYNKQNNSILLWKFTWRDRTTTLKFLFIVKRFV